jgi:hypothetical protein
VQNVAKASSGLILIPLAKANGNTVIALRSNDDKP